MNGYLRYSLLLFSTATVTLAGVFFTNVIFDPLWFARGNLVTGVNAVYNERLSKVNLYLSTNPKANYNCFIFGSSTATLLDQNQLAEKRCFNFSFAAGRIEEFVAYAEWLRHHGAEPDHIVVGVDDFNFVELEEELRIPRFIREKTSPPNIFETYLSIDALSLSAQTFLRAFPGERIYDPEFVGGIREEVSEYEPEIDVEQREPRSQPLAPYRKLREMFPEATFVGFVPPLSAWKMVSKTPAELQHFLCSLHTLAQEFDGFYDFTLPGDVTRDPSLTYDGIHFSTAVYRDMAHRMDGRPRDFGIRVDGMSRKEYFSRYRNAFAGFRRQLDEDKRFEIRNLPAGVPGELRSSECMQPDKTRVVRTESGDTVAVSIENAEE